MEAIQSKRHTSERQLYHTNKDEIVIYTNARCSNLTDSLLWNDNWRTQNA